MCKRGCDKLLRLRIVAEGSKVLPLLGGAKDLNDLAALCT